MRSFSLFQNTRRHDKINLVWISITTVNQLSCYGPSRALLWTLQTESQPIFRSGDLSKTNAVRDAFNATPAISAYRVSCTSSLGQAAYWCTVNWCSLWYLPTDPRRNELRTISITSPSFDKRNGSANHSYMIILAHHIRIMQIALSEVHVLPLLLGCQRENAATGAIVVMPRARVKSWVSCIVAINYWWRMEDCLLDELLVEIM